MSRISFIHARFPDPELSERGLVGHLQEHLRGLRRQRLRPGEDEEDTEPADASTVEAYKLDLDPHVWTELTASDRERIDRRAACLHKARMAATGLDHLRREDRKRLEVLKDGVRLAGIETEHRADELAAALHAEFPWLSAATEQVWHAMRRSVREGWPGLRLPPLLLDGAPGIGKSVWARRLGALIGAPSMVFEATVENASFGLVGAQRGWSNAAPGRVLQTILRTRVGNPIIVVDEVEKAGSVRSSNGRSFDLSTSLLPLLEPATARDWSCPFFEVRFDMGWVGWVMTTNDFRQLPQPLLSRCPPLRLRDPSLEELIAFARRQGNKRGLSEASVEAVAEALRRASKHADRLSLRTVIRMLDLAERLEAGPVKQ